MGVAGNGSASATVAFVCTGNRARSPLAEHLLRQRIGELPLEVMSRGTSDVGGAPALPQVIQVGQSLGVDLAHHRATPLSRGELDDVDLLLGFEQHHLVTSMVDGGAAPGRVFTLPELVLGARAMTPPADMAPGARLEFLAVQVDARRRSIGDQRPPVIPDPLGASPTAFARIVHLIDDLIAELAWLLTAETPSVAARS